MGAVELARAGNEARRNGRLGEARRLFAGARAALPCGVAGVEMAEVASLEATLLRDLMLYPSALREVAVAERLYRLLGRSEQVARCEIIRGLIYQDMGDYTAAIAEHERAARRLTPGHRLTVLAAYNIVLAMADAGRVGTARVHMEALRGAEAALHPDERRRVCWIEARLLLGEERNEEARSLLLELADSYLDEGNGLDYALVLADIAEVCARLGRHEEANGALQRLAGVFGSLGMSGAEVAVRAIVHHLAACHFSSETVGAVLMARKLARSTVRVEPGAAIRIRGASDDCR